MIALLMLLFVAGPGRTETLFAIYRQALATNPTLAAARSDLASQQAARGEARAGLLPNLRAAGAVNYNDTTIEGFGKDFAGGAVPPELFAGDIDETYYGGSYSIRLVQPLVNAQAWSAVDAADARITAEEAAVAAAGQDLILKVVEAYFNLLSAQADEQVVQARRKRLAETLDRAEADLKVGTGDIIAVHEARADVDAVEASLIQTKSGVRVARSRLERLAHRPVGSIADLRQLRPRGPEPDTVGPWIESAMDHQPLLEQARHRLSAAREQIRFARRARWPGLDANAEYGYDKGTLLPSAERRQARVGLQLTLPLVEGGAIQARVRRAKAEAQALEHRLQELADRITLDTESAFLLLQNSVAGLAAASQARASAQLSLEATRKGLGLGTRTIIDLLAAIQALENAERAYHEARYDHVTLRVRLKTAAGVISSADVAAINSLLNPNERPPQTDGFK
ncbi:MAG: TolC family outer membrane protein [Desulfosarcina sp.]